MQLRIGFSPCPNDTFMLEALVHGRIDCGITWNVRIADVETLNVKALSGDLDITKLSFAAWLKVRRLYTLLGAGAALGFGCGPLLIAGKPVDEADILEGPVAIPGELTTANLLFSLRYPQAERKVAMVFSDIEDAVLRGDVVAGVIIHENRFTYTSRGLVKVLDLGEYWEQETGYPIPLGAFAIRSELGSALAEQAEEAIRASVRFAMAHPAVVMPYVRLHAQEMDDQVMESHISTYVNAYSVNLQEPGRLAIEELARRAEMLSHTFTG
jgi:1,4-dihydroxy-6-naphthoate synthase